MSNNKLYYIFAWIITVVIVSFSLYIQQRVFINGLICWHLDATQRLLEGGNYLQNFFQPEPPIILYIYIPVVLLAKLFATTPLSLFHFYIYILAFLSLFICYYCLRRIISEDDEFIGGLLLIGLALVYFILPSNYFGSRENLAIILTMPYFFLSTQRCKNKTASAWVGIIVGFAAGFGFCLKLIYLSAFILTEIYLVTKRKTLSSLARSESILIISICVLYIISLYTITPNYIHIIFPLAFHYYRDMAFSSMYNLIVNGVVLMWLCATLLMIAFRKMIHYPDFSNILFVSATGLLASFFFGGNPEFVYQTPGLAVVILLAFLQVTSLAVYVMKHSKMASFSDKISSVYVIMLFIIIIVFIPSLTAYKVRAHIYEKTSPNSTPNKLLNFLNYSNYRGPLYFFSTKVSPGAEVVAYSGLTSASRFPQFWLLPIIQKKKVSVKKMFLNAVITDFKIKRPNLVFVDTTQKDFINPSKLFDYVKYFEQDSRFQTIWQHYLYQTTINGFAIYLLNNGNAYRTNIHKKSFSHLLSRFKEMFSNIF